MKKFSATRFSKKCVFFCLGMCTLVTIVTLFRAELTSGTIGVIMGVWGGELILLLIKRVVGDKTDTDKKERKEDTV